MVDVAAGMATCGLRPVVSTFALFITLKAADQIRNIVCYNNLPVVFAGAYAGLSDSYDGASHQSDSRIWPSCGRCRTWPSSCPADACEVRQAIEAALRRQRPHLRPPLPQSHAGPVRGRPALEIGRIRKLRDGSDLTIARLRRSHVHGDRGGRTASPRQGIAVDLLEVSTLKPLDEAALAASARKTGQVLTVEEHTIFGGLGGAVAEALAQAGAHAMDCIGIEDRFAESGDYMALMGKYGISAEQHRAKARRMVEGAIA